MATETSSMGMKRPGRATACSAFAVLLAGMVIFDSSAANAQRPTRRRQPTIEIRGTVPTPQVVTVRPREVPAYSRQVLVPRFYDHDFWPEIQEGYAIMSSRVTPADSLVLAADSVGTPDLFRLPAVAPLTPLRAQFGYLHKQYEWCAPHWWCPSRRVRVRVPADSAALFPPRLPPQPMAAAPGNNANPNAPTALPQVQQRWCATHWWCPPGGIVNTPPSTTPGTTAPTTPSDTTRRPPTTPADTTRRPPPGTSSASR
jgi:hypothetical protein